MNVKNWFVIVFIFAIASLFSAAMIFGLYEAGYQAGQEAILLQLEAQWAEGLYEHHVLGR